LIDLYVCIHRYVCGVIDVFDPQDASTDEISIERVRERGGAEFIDLYVCIFIYMCRSRGDGRI